MSVWMKYTANGKRAVHRWSRSNEGHIPHAISDCGMVSFWWALSKPVKQDRKCSRCTHSMQGAGRVSGR